MYIKFHYHFLLCVFMCILVHAGSVDNQGILGFHRVITVPLIVPDAVDEDEQPEPVVCGINS